MKNSGGAQTAAKAEATEEKDVRTRIFEKLHELLVLKASAVVVGILLKNLLSHTAKFVLFGADPAVSAESAGLEPSKGSLGNASLHLLIAFCLFLIMLSSSVVAKVGVGRMSIPDSLKKTYSAGLSLIPAWAWKDVVVAIISMCTQLGWIDQHPQSLAMMAMGIAIFSSLLQILLEYLVCAWPEDSFACMIVNVFKVSLGLGVAFSVNVCFQSFLSDELKSNFLVQSVWCVILTILVALAQAKGGDALADKEQTLPVRTAKFLLTAGNFVVAFAWKGFWVITVLKAHFLDYFVSKKVAYFWSALVITFLGVNIVIACASLNMRKSISSLSTMAIGMNIGWAWADFASVCMVSGMGTVTLGALWLYTILATVFACVIAVTADKAFNFLEGTSSELKPLLPAEKA